MLARPARRATYHRALRSGELIPQNEWELRRSAGSGMLKGDPLTRGAMLALPIRALESGELIPQNEKTLSRSEGSGILIGNPLIVRGVILALPLQWWPEWLKIQEDPQKPPRGLTSRPSVRQFENTEPAWSHHKSTWLQFLVGNSFLRMRAYNATYIELWRAENSFLRMRRNSDAQQGAACS